MIRDGADIELLVEMMLVKRKHFRLACLINTYIHLFIQVYIYM